MFLEKRKKLINIKMKRKKNKKDVVKKKPVKQNKKKVNLIFRLDGNN